jgi:hypothetical protein
MGFLERDVWEVFGAHHDPGRLNQPALMGVLRVVALAWLHLHGLALNLSPRRVASRSYHASSGLHPLFSQEFSHGIDIEQRRTDRDDGGFRLYRLFFAR